MFTGSGQLSKLLLEAADRFYALPFLFILILYINILHLSSFNKYLFDYHIFCPQKSYISYINLTYNSGM